MLDRDFFTFFINSFNHPGGANDVFLLGRWLHVHHLAMLMLIGLSVKHDHREKAKQHGFGGSIHT